jgi:hypothetical protein
MTNRSTLIISNKSWKIGSDVHVMLANSFHAMVDSNRIPETGSQPGLWVKVEYRSAYGQIKRTLHHQTRRTVAIRAVYFDRSTQVKRMTTADNIAEATLCLASNLAKNISDQVLAVNAVHPKRAIP